MNMKTSYHKKNIWVCYNKNIFKKEMSYKTCLFLMKLNKKKEYNFRDWHYNYQNFRIKFQWDEICHLKVQHKYFNNSKSLFIFNCRPTKISKMQLKENKSITLCHSKKSKSFEKERLFCKFSSYFKMTISNSTCACDYDYDELFTKRQSRKKSIKSYGFYLVDFFSESSKVFCTKIKQRKASILLLIFNAQVF